jgi:transglutaminase-like putative cysteine protease
MIIRYGYDFTLELYQPTPMVCLLTVHDERAADMVVPEAVITQPEVPTTTYRDMFGNTCRRFVAPAGAFQIWGDGTVRDEGVLDAWNRNAAEVPVGDLPDACLVYLVGSRYCETDRLSQTAWDLFGTVTPGWARVQAICDYVHNHIAFDYMGARATRTALEAWQEGIGVCRDYAHLAVTLCRCMNIPARYVNGYLGDFDEEIVSPADFCAWMEVWLDGGWVTFDPRNNRPRRGRIVVARGRDAADIPLINSFGPHTLNGFRVWTYDITDMPAPTPGADTAD